MLEINGKKFLNEQEAICYLLNEVQTLKQSLGSALPDPIEGPEGPTGPTGATGPQGERGTGVFGCSAVLPSPSAYKDGDFYVLFNGNLYKKVLGNWVLQTNLKGPQGPVGLEGGTQVIANPVELPTDNLYKITIDGTTYDVLSSTLRTYLDNLQNYFEYDSENDEYTLEKDISFLGWTTFEGQVDFEGGFTIEFDSSVGPSATLGFVNGSHLKLHSLDQVIDDVNLDPIIVCENFKDKNGNHRFIEGSVGTYSPVTSIKTYTKWSLSGSHLLVVLCVYNNSGSDVSVPGANNIGYLADLPAWIVSKITPMGSSQHVCDTFVRGVVPSDLSQDNNLQHAYLVNNGTTVYINTVSATFKNNFFYRIQFDLLIDME